MGFGVFAGGMDCCVLRIVYSQMCLRMRKFGPRFLWLTIKTIRRVFYTLIWIGFRLAKVSKYLTEKFLSQNRKLGKKSVLGCAEVWSKRPDRGG